MPTPISLRNPVAAAEIHAVVDVVARYSVEQPDRPAVVGRGRPDLTYGELIGKVEKQRARGHVLDNVLEHEPRYVIFTSGTTGRPKGAVVARDGMLNHLWAKVIDLDLRSADVLALTAPLAFDISVWQMLAPLLVGAAIVVVTDADGGPGELFIGGVPVGLGCIGDLGRVVDGVVQYLGRPDRQVKVDGVRMERDEIEAVLSRHPRVAQCAVTVGEPPRGRLMAHYVANAVEPAELEAFLHDRLPNALVPQLWDLRADLPLTPHGKIDHRAPREDR